MSVPMLSVSIGCGISGAFNAVSIIATSIPLVMLMTYYKRHSKDEAAKSITNSATDDTPYAYGRYTFTDNLKAMKRATIVCLISFFIRSIFSLALDIGRSVINPDPNVVSVLIALTALQSSLYFIGKCCIYYIFILRIKYSFQGNKFAFSKASIITLICIFVLMIVGFVALMMVLMFSTDLFVFGIVGGLCFLCDTILSVGIVLLFLQRLKMISKDFGYVYSTDNEVAMMVNNDDNNKRKDELNYIDIITRYSWISFVSICTCIIWEYLVAADSLSVALNPSLVTSNEISLIKLIQWVMLPIDAMANVWCIYFNTAFSTVLYNKSCKPCHNCCKRCFT